jgi:hypothetical protein
MLRLNLELRMADEWVENMLLCVMDVPEMEELAFTDICAALLCEDSDTGRMHRWQYTNDAQGRRD